MFTPPPPMFELHVYTHYAKLTRLSVRMQGLFQEFARKYVQMGLVKVQREWKMRPLKTFAFSTSDKAEHRIHINQLPEFYKFLNRNYVQATQYIVRKEHPHVGLSVDLLLRGDKTPRDYQVKAIDYCTEENRRPKMVELRTGLGKTLVALTAASLIGKRLLILIKPTFMEKWCADVLENYDIEKSDIMTVTGSAQLKGIMDLARNDQLHSKVIILSSSTYQNFIRLYEMDRDGLEAQDYDFMPEDIFTEMKIGTVIIDEVHMEFHAQYKSMLFTNVEHSINLSATLINNNKWLEWIYEVIFPKDDRYIPEEFFPTYVKAYPVSYRCEDPDRIRTTERGSNMYSHNAYEQFILTNIGRFKNYMKMLDWLLEISYLDGKQKGDKAALFASSVAMCTAITNHMRQKHPGLTVNRYVAEDPYQHCIGSDIVVTTILSGGTAKDIPGLTVVINTINILSSQGNVQTVGRLREIKGRDVKYYSPFCLDIPKHIEYNLARETLLKSRVAVYKGISYNGLI